MGGEEAVTVSVRPLTTAMLRLPPCGWRGCWRRIIAALLKTAEPATSTLAPARATSPALAARDAAIDLDVDVPSTDHLADLRDLVQHGRDEGLAAKAGIDRHHQNEIEPVEHMLAAPKPASTD